MNIVLSSEEEDKFMHSFGLWLMSPDGGLKNMRSANQHCNVVMSIMRAIDPENKDYSKLFLRKNLNDWVCLFESKGKKPGTIKTYLGSIKQFFDYISVVGHSSIQVSSEEIRNLTILVTRWCRNYHKKIQVQKHSKNLEDLAKLPQPDDINNLDKSSHVSEAVKVISKLVSVRGPPSRKEFCIVRDYLLTYVILENASRPGCISNMTLKELERREIQSDGSYIVSVLNHKTVATAGPAMLSINPDIMRHLMIYLKIRNSLPGISVEDRDPVFVSWSGRRMDSTMVTTKLNQFWKIAVNKDLSRAINPTLIRKMTTTTVHEQEPSRKREVATIMNHDIRTVEKNYFLQEKKKSVSETGAFVRSIIRGGCENQMDESELLKIFPEDNITTADVRDKIMKYPELAAFQEKKLVDKVCLLFSNVYAIARLTMR